MYWTGESINNILSYFGLVDARISASDKDLPVTNENVDKEPESEPDNDKSDREIIDTVHEKVELISDPVVFQRQPFRLR